MKYDAELKRAADEDAGARIMIKPEFQWRFHGDKQGKMINLEVLCQQKIWIYTSVYSCQLLDTRDNICGCSDKQ